MKTTLKIPKLDTILATQEEAEANSATEDQETFGDDPFTFDMLKTHWDHFANQKKKEGKDSEFMVLNQQIDLIDDSTVRLMLTNSVKEVILDKFRSDLVYYLKSKLNNGNIKLVTHLLEAEAKKMIYTNQEKFNHLADKQPILHSLKERLGLDPDF